MGRTPCCSKEGLNRGAWTATEDQMLIDYINVHGEGKWRTIPKEAGLKRCGKSCRLRWLNYLKPDIKRGNISPDEEDLIIRLHKLLGNRWSLIAGRLPGRTDNEIKNYWNTTLKKKLRGEQPKSKQSNNEKTKKKKKTPPPLPHLEAKTETHKVKTEVVTDERVGDNDVQVGLKSKECPMEYTFGELLVSDFPDSDFWKLFQNNCCREDGGGDHRSNGPGTGGASTRISLEQPGLFSEDMLKDWMREDYSFRNQTI